MQARFRHIKWVMGLVLIEKTAWLQQELARRSASGRRAWLKALARDTFIRQRCYFCKRALIQMQTHGKTSWWIRAEITVHHINGDHDDDRPKNHALAHAACHRRHHILITARLRGKAA